MTTFSRANVNCKDMTYPEWLDRFVSGPAPGKFTWYLLDLAWNSGLELTSDVVNNNDLLVLLPSSALRKLSDVWVQSLPKEIRRVVRIKTQWFPSSHSAYDSWINGTLDPPKYYPWNS